MLPVRKTAAGSTNEAMIATFARSPALARNRASAALAEPGE